jgi:hypothetical protein
MHWHLTTMRLHCRRCRSDSMHWLNSDVLPHSEQRRYLLYLVPVPRRTSNLVRQRKPNNYYKTIIQ